MPSARPLRSAGETRPFGFWTATALVMGGMIGSGIFVLPAQLAPYGWTAFIAWLVSIAGTLVVALVIVALLRRLPNTTGIIAICGEGLGPLPGVVMGWSYWISCWCGVAVMALTAVRYVAVFVPAIGATPFAQVMSATALIWLLTALNLAGMRLAGGFQVATTLIKLLPLIAVVVIAAGLMLAGGGAFKVSAQPPFSTSGLTPALTLAFFALVGFEAVSTIVERVRDPERNVVRATLFGLSLTGLLYLIVSTAISTALSPGEAAASGAPFALFVGRYWGHGAGTAVAAFAAIAAIGAMNGWILIQGEVLLGMARAGLIPSWFARTDARDIPVGLLAMSSLLASALVLSSAAQSLGGMLDFGLRMTTAASIWVYAGACLAALLLKVSRVLAWVGLAFSAWVMWGAGIDAIGLSFLLMLTGVPLYWFRFVGRPAMPGFGQPPRRARVEAVEPDAS